MKRVEKGRGILFCAQKKQDTDKIHFRTIKMKLNNNENQFVHNKTDEGETWLWKKSVCGCMRQSKTND